MGTIRGKSLCIASFDIAKKNFAHYIEYLNSTHLNALKLLRLSKVDSYTIADNLSLIGERIDTGVFDLRPNGQDVLDIDTRKNIIRHLEDYKPIFQKVDVFVIEQQYFRTMGKRGLSKPTGANVDAIKIGELLVTWLLTSFPSKDIDYFPSNLKTKIYTNTRLNDKDRKRFSIEKASVLYKNRGDDIYRVYSVAEEMRGRRIITEKSVLIYTDRFKDSDPDIRDLAEQVVRDRQKLDDVSDAFLQCQAFKKRYFKL